MYKIFGEISNSTSHNPSVGCISINGHGRRGHDLDAPTSYRLPFYGNLEGIYECGYTYAPGTCGFTKTLTSSSSSLTPSEDDPRLLSPVFDSCCPVPEMMLEELRLLEKFPLLQVQENKTKIRLAPADAVTADPYSSFSSNGGAPYLRSSVLRNCLPSDEGRTRPMGYSIDRIGHKGGFSYPPLPMTKNPDVSTDAMLTESFPLHRINGLHFNPTLGLIDNEISLNALNNNLQYGSPILNRRSNNAAVHPSLDFPWRAEAIRFDDSFIMPERVLTSKGHTGNGHGDRRMAQINNANMETFQRCQRLNHLHAKMIIYNLAKNQDGCIYLQKKIEEGRAEPIELIFCGVIDHAVELMENTFGNYLMQKLLEVCNLQQRMAIVLLVTENPFELIRISQNTHGTRAVQKLIEKIKTRQEILLVTAALGSGVLRLIKDINGNHVVQKCLLSLEPEDNKFIFAAAARHCVEIATHQHGCCVLQCCISRSNGDHYTKLIYEISTNGLLLARDPFGNYVVQFILDLDNPAANEILKSQFKGHFVNLSMQKFGSNVVEKCLKVFNHNERAKIVSELLHRDVFELLVQDPFANYVIQSALANTKGSPLYVSLVQAIRRLAPKLKATLHCRRILSRVLKNGH